MDDRDTAISPKKHHRLGLHSRLGFNIQLEFKIRQQRENETYSKASKRERRSEGGGGAETTMEDTALLIAAACFIALLVVLYVCITSAVVPKALHPDKKVREREKKNYWF